jgi:HSP20 family molecular chaperone IbpA
LNNVWKQLFNQKQKIMTYYNLEKMLNEFIKDPWMAEPKKYTSYVPTKAVVDLKDDRLELALSVIGHDPKNVEVNLTEDQINIRATKDKENKEVGNQFVFDIDETLNLSKEYDGLSATAEIKNGVITIIVEKKEAQKPKKLSIKF